MEKIENKLSNEQVGEEYAQAVGGLPSPLGGGLGRGEPWTTKLKFPENLETT